MFSASDNVEDVLRQARQLHPQFEFAVARALTISVQVAQAGLPGALGSALDRPTDFTKRGTYIKAARKGDLVAEVGFKDKQASYLHWQVEGGQRAPSRRALRLPAVVKLNDFGNLPTGLIKQLIARAKAGRRATKSQSRRFGVSKELDLFYGEPGDGRPAGLYKRVVLSGTRHQLIPIVVFPKRAASYRARRFDLDGYCYVSIRKAFPSAMDRAWAQALASAR